jgi:hypothetical protein
MKRFKPAARAVLVTLAYADIFDFPLTASEITRYCVEKRISKKTVLRTLSRLASAPVDDRTFCVLNKRTHLIPLRRMRGKESPEKWIRVSRIARWLSYIPTISLIGVTGALAMGNAGKGDDIDLFIIAEAKTVWITRFLTVCVVEMFGKRRRPGDVEVANSICLNMFVAKDGVVIPRNERDLYVAHEIMQMIPVFVRGSVYAEFLRKNRWVRKYLPNWWEEKKAELARNAIQRQRNGRFFDDGNPFLWIVIRFLRFFDPFCKWFQLSYMEKRRTTEVLGDTVLRFHPRDTRSIVSEELSKRLFALNIPLDNVFVMSIK